MVWGVGVAAVLVADRRVDGLASFTLEPGRNAGERGFGQEDEMVSRWRCDRWWAFLGRAETSRVGGGVPSPGVPWGCRGGATRPPRTPMDANPARGRLSRRDARDRFDRAVPSLRRRRRRWGSAATVSPAGTTGRLSSGVIKGVSRVSGGCVGGTGLTSIDNASRRVATGRWLPPSRPTPSGVSLVGQRSAARCRRSGWKRCPV